MHFLPPPQPTLTPKCVKQAALYAPSDVVGTDTSGEIEFEIEIDVDSEIEYLELWSGVAAESGHVPAQVCSFVSEIASLCAEAADHGANMSDMIKAANLGSRHRTEPWRMLALLLAQRCDTLVRHYGIDPSGAQSGEVVRWLFADLAQPCTGRDGVDH